MTRSVGQRVGGWVGDFLACKGKNTFFFFWGGGGGGGGGILFFS